MNQKISVYLRIFLKVIWHKIIPFWLKTVLYKSPHGDMKDIDYAKKIFKRHVSSFIQNPKGVLLEIGPGDSPFCALHALEYGFKEVLLIDNGTYFDQDIYKIRQKPIKYLRNGSLSLNEIKDCSVDHSFSHTVLQHIHKEEFNDFIKNLYRIMKVGSKSSHHIDFKDMLYGRFDHLIAKSKIWESKIIKSCFFYTNRLRKSSIIYICKSVGFEVDIIDEGQFENIKYDREIFCEEFKKISNEDLKCSGIHIVLRKT